MSFQFFFSMSSGLSKPLLVPTDTYAAIMDHVQRVEKILRLERERYLDNPTRWKSIDLNTVNPEPDRRMYTPHWWPGQDRGRDILHYSDGPGEYSWAHPSGHLFDDLLCATVEWHNRWVRRLYAVFGKWSEEPVDGGEELTPEQSKEFWHALTILEVPVGRWTRTYYCARMESLYEVMRGRDSEGASFDEEPLTQRQAAQVINLFSRCLDEHDLRLDVPRDLGGEGYDYLASSYDGGYDWCENCGPMHPDVWEGCPKRRECPLIAELCQEDQAEVLGEDEGKP